MKNNKPQHLRLSIMQAQEILQHESTFHAKYGRRLSTGGSASNASNTDSNKQSEIQASRCGHASIGTPPNNPVQKKENKQSLHKQGYLKGVGLKVDQREILACGLKREKYVVKQDESNHDHPLGPSPSVERSLHDDNPTNADRDKVERTKLESTDQESRVMEIRLKLKQEESLKRQKEKEQTEGHERERVKFLKELEDQERQKIITEYLQHVYSQYSKPPSPHAGNKKSGHNTRTYTVSKQGRPCSVGTRQTEEHNPDVPQVVTRPAPIWHQTGCGSPGDKKISFRAKQGITGANGVRFFNEWNNSLFTEYINSPVGDAETGKEKDKLQVMCLVCLFVFCCFLFSCLFFNPT